jgi:hypothetical protein
MEASCMSSVDGSAGFFHIGDILSGGEFGDFTGEVPKGDETEYNLRLDVSHIEGRFKGFDR